MITLKHYYRHLYYQQEQQWIEALEKRSLGPDQLVAVSKSYGMSELLMVRETFKMPIMIMLYTVLVISACFHAFNGLWTFFITWGATLSVKSQRMMRTISTVLMFLVAFLGLACYLGNILDQLETIGRYGCRKKR